MVYILLLSFYFSDNTQIQKLGDVGVMVYEDKQSCEKYSSIIHLYDFHPNIIVKKSCIAQKDNY